MAPFGVFFLVMSTVMKKGGDLAGLAFSLGAYLGTVTLALTLHALITLPALFFVVTRRYRSQSDLTLMYSMVLF